MARVEFDADERRVIVEAIRDDDGQYEPAEYAEVPDADLIEAVEGVAAKVVESWIEGPWNFKLGKGAHDDHWSEIHDAIRGLPTVHRLATVPTFAPRHALRDRLQAASRVNCAICGQGFAADPAIVDDMVNHAADPICPQCGVVGS